MDFSHPSSSIVHHWLVISDTRGSKMQNMQWFTKLIIVIALLIFIYLVGLRAVAFLG